MSDRVLLGRLLELDQVRLQRNGALRVGMYRQPPSADSPIDGVTTLTYCTHHCHIGTSGRTGRYAEASCGSGTPQHEAVASLH